MSLNEASHWNDFVLQTPPPPCRRPPPTLSSPVLCALSLGVALCGTHHCRSSPLKFPHTSRGKESFWAVAFAIFLLHHQMNHSRMMRSILAGG